MKTYRCGNCGFHVQRPAQPYRCPQCGGQAVGLFKVVPNAGPPVPPAPVQPSPPAASPAPPVVRPPAPPCQTPPPGPAPAVPPAIAPAAQPAPAPPVEPARTQSQRTKGTSGGAAAPRAQPQPATRPSEPKPHRARPERPPATAGKPVARPAASAASRAAETPPKPEARKPAPRIRPQPSRPQQFLWAYPAQPPYEDESRPMRHAPAVDSQGQVILYTQGRLLALREEEGKGKVVWEYATGSHVPGRVVVAADDTIRIHTADGFLHGVTPAGRQLWSPAQVGEPLGWAAPVVDASGNTWLSAYDGGLIRVSPEGKPDHRPYLRTRSKLDSAALIHGGVLYVGSEDGYVLSIPLGADRGVNQWNQAAEQGYTGGFVNSAPAMAQDGVLVVAARDEKLWGFTPGGTAAWIAQVPGQILGSPVVGRHGHVYVGASRAERGQPPCGSLVCVDGNSHKIRWEYAAVGPVESTPVIGDDDVLYFGDNSGTIHALDDRGKPLWTAKVESPVRCAGTILGPERVAFGLDDDTLVVLRCSSKGLSPGGWPKIAGTLGQSGLVAERS